MVYKLVSTLTKDATNHSRMTFNRDSKTAGIAKVNLTPDTWDPDYKGTNVTLSNGDLTMDITSGSWQSALSINTNSTGKFYFELDCIDIMNFTMVGVIKDGVDVRNTYLGVNIDGHAYYALDGNAYNNNSGASWGNTYTDADVIGVAVDLDNQAVYFAKNNVFQNSSDPTSGSSRTGVHTKHYLTASTEYKIVASSLSSLNDLTANFGASSFNYTPPDGYTSGWGVLS